MSNDLYASRKAVYAKAHGHWPLILHHAGLPENALQLKKSGPCPMCGGTDRYVFSDRSGDGDFHCRGCVGGGKGVTLLMKFNQWSWSEAVDWVLHFLADPQHVRLLARSTASTAPSAENDPADEHRRALDLLKVWDGARPVEQGDPVHLYLAARVPGIRVIPECLRFHPGLPFWWQASRQEKFQKLGTFPAMVARIVDAQGRLCNIHRTYLDGSGRKAQPITPDGEILQDVKKLMRGLVGKGLRIPLVGAIGSNYAVAEGIETALASTSLTGIPTDSVISTAGMRGAVIPDVVDRLTLFQDNDPPDAKGRLPGRVAVEALRGRADIAERVRSRQLHVGVRTSARVGSDMADLFQARRMSA